MKEIERRVISLISSVEHAYDSYKRQLGSSFISRRSLLIYPYLGYGSPDFVYLKGRVLVDKGIRPARRRDSAWANLVNMYRRFESDEIPFARLLVRLPGHEQLVQADEEGFFEVRLNLTDSLPAGLRWQTLDVELIEPTRGDGEPVRAQGHVLIVPPGAEFGVISDIDDTVVQTGATNRLRMVFTVFLRNAHTRLPLEGVAHFYRALQEGASGAGWNPLFYVSSSPWNLYDLFLQFFQINDIPTGPLIFRDWGIAESSMLSFQHRRFKLNAIRRILEDYPNLPFILIGDSGEEDPEIYTEVIRTFPRRILAAYIRDVQAGTGGRKRRREALERLAEEVETLGSSMVLAAQTSDMVRHAARCGWICLSPRG